MPCSFAPCHVHPERNELLSTSDLLIYQTIRIDRYDGLRLPSSMAMPGPYVNSWNTECRIRPTLCVQATKFEWSIQCNNAIRNRIFGRFGENRVLRMTGCNVSVFVANELISRLIDCDYSTAVGIPSTPASPTFRQDARESAIRIRLCTTV
jgi:hypothetical protein